MCESLKNNIHVRIDKKPKKPSASLQLGKNIVVKRFMVNNYLVVRVDLLSPILRLLVRLLTGGARRLFKAVVD